MIRLTTLIPEMQIEGDPYHSGKRGYIGLVYNGTVEGINRPLENVMEVDHSEIRTSIFHGRFRYFFLGNIVKWTDEPTPEEVDVANKWLAKKGVYPRKHIMYVDPSMVVGEDKEDAPSPEIVDRLAKAKGYTHSTYRGDIDADRINVYSPRERREHGIFTTPDKESAAVYARDKEPRKFYVRAKRVLDLTKDTMANMKWVMKWGESFDDWTDRQSGEPTDAWIELSGGRMFDYEGDWSTERWMDIQATAENQGYDAIILPDFDSHRGVFPSFVVFDERNLKLADPVTYDDNDQPIPLQQRFNAASNDIRY